MSEQQRLKDRVCGSKPRVYKQRPNGLWWADVMKRDGQYACDVFANHAAAISAALKYAAGQQ